MEMKSINGQIYIFIINKMKSFYLELMTDQEIIDNSVMEIKTQDDLISLKLGA